MTSRKFVRAARQTYPCDITVVLKLLPVYISKVIITTREFLTWRAQPLRNIWAKNCKTYRAMTHNIYGLMVKLHCWLKADTLNLFRVVYRRNRPRSSRRGVKKLHHSTFLETKCLDWVAETIRSLEFEGSCFAWFLRNGPRSMLEYVFRNPRRLLIRCIPQRTDNIYIHLYIHVGKMF